MNVVVGINCPDFECVKKCWSEAAAFGAPAVQIDVADGKFAPVRSWDDPAELAGLAQEAGAIETEIHLMVEKPEGVFEKWLAAGVKRLVIHVESAGDLKLIRKNAVARGAEVVWGIKFDSDPTKLEKYLNDSPESAVQFLAVPPGFSGQEFNPSILEKIKFLRKKWPNVKIRVDGGMNLGTAERVRNAGADAVVAVSYIWKSNSPAEAYQSLLRV